MKGGTVPIKAAPLFYRKNDFCRSRPIDFLNFLKFECKDGSISKSPFFGSIVLGCANISP